MIIFFVLLFALMVLLPFFPAVYEIYKREDADKLFVNMDYSKDPRYFGKSFRRIILNALKSNVNYSGAVRFSEFDLFLTGKNYYLTNGSFERKMSKAEIIEVQDEKNNVIENPVNCVLFHKRNLIIKDSVKCNKEIYAMGSVDIGKGCRILSLASDGNIVVRQESKLIRWLDAEGNISILENCDLGISVAAGKRINIEKGCSFKRLYGSTISTDKTIGNAVRQKLKAGEQKFSYVAGNLEIKKGVKIKGNMKINGNFIVNTKERVEIYGSVFAEGYVDIAGNAFVDGSIFSQKSICLKGVEVGKVDSIRSIIGKKEILLYEDVIVHGYILTEGIGLTK